MTSLICFGRWAESKPYSVDKNTFFINGYLWRVCYVNPNDPYLVDRTNSLRVATTDPSRYCVYLSSELSGDFLRTVLVHELGHAVMFSYGLLPAIHSFVKPDHWIEAEEWVCNFVADYGDGIFDIANDILSTNSFYLPRYSA